MNLEHQWGVRVYRVTEGLDLTSVERLPYILDCSSRDNAEGALEGLYSHHPELNCELVSRVVAYGSWEVEKER